MSQSYALILAGGGGTRLWPASRRQRPKQLLTLGGEETLVAATFRRAATLCTPERTLVVTAADQAASVAAALPDLPRDNLLVEPAPRNTAAAVGLGAAAIARRAGEEARFAVLPSDTHVADEAAFQATAARALAHASEAIVTIGVRPTHPETGFGYMRLGNPTAPGVYEVEAFVEKPTEERARTYLAAGYLWNAGMFFLSAGRLLLEAERHMPALGSILRRLIAAPDFAAAAETLYPAAPATSIDFGIMERAAGILAVPGDFGWNDVGSWAALPSIRTADEHGNVVSGDALAIGTRGSVILAEEGAPFVAVSGIDDVVVVATADAILVTRRESAQSVRGVVEALAARGRKELL